MIDIIELKKDTRQLALNLLTASVVGVIINNLGGLGYRQRLLAAFLLGLTGLTLWFFGLLKRVKQ